jgi:hypothetical protein
MPEGRLDQPIALDSRHPPEPRCGRKRPRCHRPCLRGKSYLDNCGSCRRRLPVHGCQHDLPSGLRRSTRLVEGILAPSPGRRPAKERRDDKQDPPAPAEDRRRHRTTGDNMKAGTSGNGASRGPRSTRRVPRSVRAHRAGDQARPPVPDDLHRPTRAKLEQGHDPRDTGSRICSRSGVPIGVDGGLWCRPLGLRP